MVLLLIAPLFLRDSHYPADRTEAVSNARQIGLALFEFENEYGSYPDASTIGKIKATTLPLGTKTSNDFFRQLFPGKYTSLSGLDPQSERMFYARIDGAHKPDCIVTGTDALAKGECGFTYFLGAKTGTDNPHRPLAVTPMIPGTDRFDPKPFDGKAVVLRIDNSVINVPIDKDGHVLIDGKNMMSTSHPIWDGHAPVIAWPDL